MNKRELMLMIKMAKEVELKIPNVGFLPTTYEAMEKLLSKFDNYTKLDVSVSLLEDNWENTEILLVTLSNVNYE